MKIYNVKSSLIEKALIAFMFVFTLIEVIAELSSFEPILFAFKPLIALLILILYLITSKVRNTLFISASIFLFIVSVLLIPNSSYFSLAALAGYIIHRSLLITYIIKINKVKDFIPVVIAIIPTLFIFSYLLSIADEINRSSFYGIVVQNIVISIMAGLVISNYFMNDNNDSPWLYIYGLLFTALYFTVFIEKCFLSTFPPTFFRPLGMLLYVSSYYAFYRFVIDTENIHKDRVQ
jgi:hypothetical protein